MPFSRIKLVVSTHAIKILDNLNENWLSYEVTE